MKVNKKIIFASLSVFNFLDVNADGCCKAVYANGQKTETKEAMVKSAAECNNLPNTNLLWRGVPRGSTNFEEGKKCYMNGSAIGQVLEMLRQAQSRKN